MTANRKLDKNRVWRMLEEARASRGELRFIPLLRHLREQGQQFDIAELFFLEESLGSRWKESGTPHSVATFLGHLAQSRQSDRILDPAGSVGLLGAWLATDPSVHRVDVISRLVAATEVTTPLELKSLEVHIGSVADAAPTLEKRYDAILTSGPVGLDRESRTYKTPTGEIDLSDDAACLLIADVADRVGPDGFLAVVVAPRFAWDTKPKSVRRNLPRFGLYLSALLTFPPGTFSGTSLAFELAVIDRSEHDTLFVAEVPVDLQAQKELAEHLWKRKPGPTPRQGSLIPEGQYSGLSALEAKQRTELLAKGKGLEPVPFRQADPFLAQEYQGHAISDLKKRLKVLRGGGWDVDVFGHVASSRQCRDRGRGQGAILQGSPVGRLHG